MTAPRKKRGRKKKASRAERRVVVRVRPADEKIIAQLRAQLDVGASELMRRGLRELAERVLKNEGK